MRMLILCTLFLSGCTQLAGMAPSLQHCDRVSYLREGNKVTISADCSVPIGGSPLTL